MFSSKNLNIFKRETKNRYICINKQIYVYTYCVLIRIEQIQKMLLLSKCLLVVPQELNCRSSPFWWLLMTFKKLLKTESSSRWTPNLLACRKTIIEKIFIFGIFSVTQLRTQLSSIFLPPQSAPSVSPSVLPSARPSVPSVRLYNPPHLVKYKTISVYRCLCLLREKKKLFFSFFFQYII